MPSNTSIRGFDIEDGGGVLTATHTISLEARDRDGVVIGASFTLPPGATQRGDADNPAFSFDRAGSVPVTATWSHYRDDVGTDCTATVRRDLRLARPLRRVRVEGPGRTTMAIDGFQSALRAGRNYDRRPVQVRLRGTRHARLPGPGAPAQTLTLAFRRGDRGLGFDGRQRVLRAAGGCSTSISPRRTASFSASAIRPIAARRSGGSSCSGNPGAASGGFPRSAAAARSGADSGRVTRRATNLR